MPRFRDLGATVGTLTPGPQNRLTDVPGVRVGQVTLHAGDAIRTGVTAIVPAPRDPFVYRLPAAVHTINGYGKAAGFEQVRELGVIETPILLTNTLAVGRAVDALVGYLIQRHPRLTSVNPLVGETNDGYLNDIRQRVIGPEHVAAALDGAGEAVAEGCVGAGAGTSAYQFKGGIGTASRRMGESGYTLGALVQTNFGLRQELQVLGVPVGATLTDLMPSQADDAGGPRAGSIMVVIATDAPLTARQLGRVARRVTFGIARTGTIGLPGSGDFAVAFSTAFDRADSPYQIAQPIAWVPDEAPLMADLFRATVESVEEAIYNAMLAAQTTTGRKGYTLHALPHDRLRHLLHTAGRLTGGSS